MNCKTKLYSMNIKIITQKNPPKTEFNEALLSSIKKVFSSVM